MKVIFAHDHYFYRDNKGEYFSSGKLPYTTWERYLRVFDHIFVVSRHKDLRSSDNQLKLNKSSGPGVSFHPVPSISNPINKLVKKIEVEKTLESLIPETDAVIARLPSEIGAAAIKIAQKYRKPWAVEVVACAWDGLWNYGNLQGKLYAPWATYTTKKLVKQSSYAIYVTSQFLQRRYPSTGTTASCSNVELPYVGNDVLNGRIQRIDEGDRLTIGVIASLSGRHKGLDTAFKALQRVKNSGADFEFRILGDGPKDGWIALADELGIADVVVFSGTLSSGEQVFRWLDNIDIYIQPSNQEGLPRAVIEAMSRACPVIGSIAGGIPELLDPSCLHKPKDDRHLAELLMDMLSSAEKRKKFAERNHQVSKKYLKQTLDMVRTDFWNDFAQYVKEYTP